MEMPYLVGKNVVRMAFRILQSGIEIKQSSTHVFTFAVFEVSRSSFILKIWNLIFLSHHYCILPNGKCIEALINGQPGKEKAATKALSKTLLGNCIFLNQFVTACVQKKSLIDPKEYIFEVDQSTRAKCKSIKYISVARQLLRQRTPLRHGSLAYISDV